MRVLRLLVPVALVALCLWLADGAAVAGRLAGAAPGWLLLAVLLLVAQTVLSAWRWRVVAGALGLDLSPGLALGEAWLAQLVNQVLPGGVLGDAARAVRRREGGLGRAARSVVIERAAGQAGLLALAVPGLALLALGAGPLPPAARAIAAAVVALCAALALGLALASRTGAVAALLADGRAVARARGAALAPLAVLSAAANLAAFAAAARAVGAPLPLAATLGLVPLILAAMLLPASVAGWGWREGAAAALFPAAGLTAEAGVAASLAFGLAVLAASLPGAAFALRPSPRHGTRSPAE